MAAPTFVAASTGATDAGGAWTATCHAPGAAGRIIILQVLQDDVNIGDATPGSVTVTSITNAENLAGTDNVLTFIGEFQTGLASGINGYQLLWIGRSLSTSAPVVTGANSSTNDVYWRFYEFQDGNTGTTLAAVIENGSAGATTTSQDTSVTASDASVQTLGADRLALNFVAVDDDNAIAVFTGESGGDWTEAVAEYADGTGTDGAIQLQIAAMASAGTIDGGTASITSGDPWGVVGFALIGTTAGGATGTFALTANPAY